MGIKLMMIPQLGIQDQDAFDHKLFHFKYLPLAKLAPHLNLNKKPLTTGGRRGTPFIFIQDTYWSDCRTDLTSHGSFIAPSVPVFSSSHSTQNTIDYIENCVLIYSRHSLALEGNCTAHLKVPSGLRHWFWTLFEGKINLFESQLHYNQVMKSRPDYVRL